jgi:hypothetical protein
LSNSEINAFALGAFLSWGITYFFLRHEKRTIAKIKSSLEFLASYHTLTAKQSHRISPSLGGKPPLASDEEILAIYDWAVRLRADKSGSYKQLSPTTLAAEVIICQELLGLTNVHAVRALLRTKNLDELQQKLHEVTAEISSEKISN